VKLFNLLNHTNLNNYIIVFGVLMLVSNLNAVGQDISPIQTDRPDQTETPFTVPKNHFQMENGFSYEQTDDNTRSFTIPSTLFKYGLNDHFEIGLITELATIKSFTKITGLSPVTFRIKDKIADENGILPTTSIICYMTIADLASDNLKAKYLAPAFKFTMQHTLSKKFSLGYNLGVQWDGESPYHVYIYTLTTDYFISDKIGIFAEVFGFATKNSKADNRLNTGLIFLLRHNVSIDISGGIGLSDNSPKYFLETGFSFRLKD